MSGPPKPINKHIPRPGDVVRPVHDTATDERHPDRNDLLVQWVGVNGNQVICAGYRAWARTVDGRDELDPRYGVLTDYDWGRGFEVITPSPFRRVPS